MNPSAAADPPLSLEFRRVQAISSRGNQRIRVTPAGDVFAYLEQRDCPLGEEWSAPWPDAPLRRLSPVEQQELARTLLASGFLELPGRIVVAGRDGFRDEIDAALGAQRHSVRIERAPAPVAFARVRAALLAIAGPPFSACEGDNATSCRPHRALSAAADDGGSGAASSAGTGETFPPA